MRQLLPYRLAYYIEIPIACQPLLFLCCMLHFSYLGQQCDCKRRLKGEEDTFQQLDDYMSYTDSCNNAFLFILSFCPGKFCQYCSDLYTGTDHHFSLHQRLSIWYLHRSVFCRLHQLFFTYPYFDLNFTLTGYPITFIGMLVITLLTTTVTSRLKKQIAINAEREKEMEEAEREKLRANLLRAVSHDLRTPLTGIIGASASYLDAEDSLSSQEKRELIQNINDDSHWLLNMVENLLSVTRIQTNDRKVHKSPEVVEEVVSEAVLRLQKRIPDARFEVHVPDDFLMIPMDATLIEQVLINLLENAVVHSDSHLPTVLTISQSDLFTTFEVKDFGRGIDENRIDSLFLGTYSSGDSSDIHKGMGIGLSICRTIVEAHGGEITARNHEHGAVFTFTLPNSEEN